jgi:ketosteroid isomerase-like protein
MRSIADDAQLADLANFVERCHAAITQQSRGKPQPFLELWSQADDVSIMAAIGGYQVGFEAVRELLTAAAATQTFDGWNAENLVTYCEAGLACTVELEHYAKSGAETDTSMTLRATQIYRREDGNWRVIHRHGDVLAPIEAKW